MFTNFFVLILQYIVNRTTSCALFKNSRFVMLKMFWLFKLDISDFKILYAVAFSVSICTIAV